jgi:tripartite-type tricarboxylate transporter receptor subunit TctC
MFKKIILSSLIAVGVATSAVAQAWQPTKPVEAVMAWTPGSANEIIFRVLAKQVEANNPGVKFIINNKPGAGGVVGTEYFSKLPADGHSVTMVSVPGITAMDKVAVPDTNNRTYTTDTFVYPLLAASSNFVFIAHPKDPINTPEQLVNALKKEKVSVSVSGGARLVFEMLAQKTKFPQGKDGVVRVEHKGPVDTLQDVAGGHVRFGIVPSSVAYAFYKDGRVKVVALSSRALAQMPGVQPISSVVAGFDVPAGWGLMLHKNTPPEAVTWYQTEFNKALQSDEVRTIFENNLFQEEPSLQNSQAFGTHIRQLERQYQPLVDNILRQINNK